MRYAILCVVAVSLSGGCKKDEASPAGAAASGAPSVSGGIAQIVIPDVKYSSAAADTAKGKEMFAEKGCVACHKIGGGKLVGPDLKGVTARRDIRWLSRMILRPDVMVKEDETARELLKTHFTPMPNQGVNPETELPYLLSFLKANET